MQTLYVKIIGPDGKPAQKIVRVVRSWQDVNGKQVYLHANGVYGYKDGTPVISTNEFNIITDKTQHKNAQAWWKRVGRKMSEEHYEKQAKEIERRNRDGIPQVVEGDSSDLDSVSYIRRPVGDRRRAAFSDPLTWFELGFPERPGWWGAAQIIEISGYRYELSSIEQVEPDETEPGDPDPEEKTPPDQPHDVKGSTSPKADGKP